MYQVPGLPENKIPDELDFFKVFGEEIKYHPTEIVEYMKYAYEKGIRETYTWTKNQCCGQGITKNKK